MMKCPNCEKKIKKNATKCPSCNKLILKKEFKDIKIKEIPLIVKTAKKHTEIKKSNSNNKKEKTYLNYTSNITIFFIVALVLVNLILILNIINQVENKPDDTPTDNNPVLPSQTSKLGHWKSSNNSLFMFEDDDNFYWYDSYLNQDDNYYSGTYNYKNGLKALEEMGYSEEEFYKTFGDNIELENVYSINLFPTKSIRYGKDVTTNELDINEVWWYLLIVKNDQEAIGYNKDLDLRYNLTSY